MWIKGKKEKVKVLIERIQMKEASRIMEFTNDKYWIINSSEDLICLLSNPSYKH